MVSIRPCFLISFSIIGFLFATAMAFAEPASEPLDPEQTEKFLNRLLESRAGIGAVQVEFEERREARTLRDPIVTTGTLYFAPPNRFRKEVDNPASVTVSDGKTLWLYYPGFNEAERYDVSKPGPLSDLMTSMSAALDFRGLTRLFRVTVFPDNDGYRIELEPRSAAMRRNTRSLVIGLDEHLKLRSSQFISRSGEKTTTVFRNEKAIEPRGELFDFKPPSGTSVTRPLG